jgi:hypothetical protein
MSRNSARQRWVLRIESQVRGRFLRRTSRSCLPYKEEVGGSSPSTPSLRLSSWRSEWLRCALLRYQLQKDKELFDKVHSHVRQHYWGDQ